MEFLKKVTELVKNYSFILFPVLLIIAVINLYLYYWIFYNFDVVPFLNISDTIIIAFISLGKMSFSIALITLLFVFVSICIYNFQRIFLEKAGSLIMNQIAVKQLDFIRELAKFRKDNIDKGSDKLKNLHLSMIDYIKNKEGATDDEILESQAYYNNFLDEEKADKSKSHKVIDDEINKLNQAEQEHSAEWKKFWKDPFNDIDFFVNISSVKVPMNFIVFFSSLSLIPLLAIVGYTWAIEYRNSVVFSALEFFLICAFLLAISNYLLFKKYKGQYTNGDMYSIIIYLFVAISITAQTVSTAKEGLDVKHKLKYKGTVIIVDGKKYLSNDTLTFIGRTKENIFYYDLKNKATTVISSADVKSQTYVSK